MDEHLNCGPLPSILTGGDLPTRKRGNPIPVSPEVLERRIMSRQRANATRRKAKDGDLSTRKRGRPPIPLTEEILERRRMSRQRVNASHPKPEGRTKKRGRPKRAATEVILDPHPLSRPVVPDSCQQASLLIDDGRTAHSRFKIPIDANEFTCCEIKQNTFLAELICNTSLVIWDEAPMTHRFVFEAVDRTFRDIRSKTGEEARSLPFGGLTMLLGGDFRQVLPVIPKKGHEEIVAATICKSPLWQFYKVFRLHENMRIEKDVPQVTIQGRKVHFREWVLAIGDGLQEGIALGDDPEPSWITLPEEVTVPCSDEPVDAIVNEIYGDLQHRNGDLEYLRSRAVLTPLNEDVENVNMAVLQRHPGDVKEYKSCDSI